MKNKDIVSKGWDWEKNTDEYWLKPEPEVYYLAEKWKKDGVKKILDLGFGLGRHSLYFASQGFEVYSMDISTYAVAKFENYIEENHIKNIKAYEGNMSKMPFVEDFFDAIFSFHVIYHTDTNGFNIVLNEVKRVLKSKGKLFITMITKDLDSYRNGNKINFVDPNTIVLNGKEDAERGVPHFYIDLEDIKNLFLNDFVLENNIKKVENIEVDSNNNYKLFSKHFILEMMKI